VRRLVVDASVLASAAAGHQDSPSRRVLDAAVGGDVEMVACDRLLDEFDRALHRRYFTQRLTPEERAVIVELVALTVVMLPDPHTPPPVLRDPDDDYIVALARAANADAIVTGDKDLLDHAGLEPPAITPRTACERFGLA
jgi:putative PIN family toxin of toxin-antitoxin system